MHRCIENGLSSCRNKNVMTTLDATSDFQHDTTHCIDGPCSKPNRRRHSFCGHYCNHRIQSSAIDRVARNPSSELEVIFCSLIVIMVELRNLRRNGDCVTIGVSVFLQNQPTTHCRRDRWRN